jgi:cellulose synthase/poly-beta-1,6-N-acetylglucosamine synthase-like glycosyltransferase
VAGRVSRKCSCHNEVEAYKSCYDSAYRYGRYVINLVAFSCFRPIPLPEKPTLTSDDVTVILPSLEGRGVELEHTIESILENEPRELILVTIQANLELANKTIAKMPAAQHNRLRCLAVANPNKRRQMARAIPEVDTKIIVFADDDVTWPQQTLKWMLAPFENEKYGGVVTCQRLRRTQYPLFSMKRVWSFLGALYLERRNFDCASTTFMDGGVPCMSGRTVAYRTKILRDDNFTYEFTNEAWWFGKYRLNADDDNFITRWLLSHGWETYMQYHPECEVQTILEDNSKFLKQCVRWSRSNWRSNLTSMFTERHIWR